MSAGGLLCAVGLALFFASVYLAFGRDRRPDDFALAVLGAVLFAAGLVLASKGI